MHSSQQYGNKQDHEQIRMAVALHINLLFQRTGDSPGKVAVDDCKFTRFTLILIPLLTEDAEIFWHTSP
jgi:hypothetical protein